TLFVLLTEVAPPRDNGRDADPWDRFEEHWERAGRIVPGADAARMAALREIVRRACDDDPDRRYRAAEDMHRDLARLLAKAAWVQLVIPGDYDAFTDADEARWKERIRALGLNVLGIRRARGSILLRVRLSAGQADYLVARVRAGAFADEGVAVA